MGPALTNRDVPGTKTKAEKAVKAKLVKAVKTKLRTMKAKARALNAKRKAEKAVKAKEKAEKAVKTAAEEAKTAAEEAETAAEEAETAAEEAETAAEEAEVASLNCWAGGNEPYCEARKWWLKHSDCSENDLRKYLIRNFAFIADPCDDEGRAHKIALCLLQSKRCKTASVDSVSLFVSLLALVISICSGLFNNYPETIKPVLLAAIIFVVLYIVIWAVLKHVVDRCLTRDTEFRGRLSAL